MLASLQFWVPALSVAAAAADLTFNEVNDLIPKDVHSPEDLDDQLATIGTRGIDVLEGQPKLRFSAFEERLDKEVVEAMAKAGLSNRQVLEGATRLPAEWLGVITDRGEVVAGKRADLILLDANPLTNLANTRRIAAVIDGGSYLSRAMLDQRLREDTEGRVSATLLLSPVTQMLTDRALHLFFRIALGHAGRLEDTASSSDRTGIDPTG